MQTPQKRAREPVYWIGNPVACDLCRKPFGEAVGVKIVDGRLAVTGSWGILDLGCHRTHGVGVGTGKGQVYERQTDGRWLKVEG
jgi:hypothetical protein